MRWHFDLEGAEPVIRDCPIYDASGLNNGGLLQMGTTTTTSAADAGIALVTAYTGNSAEATSAVGILNDGRWSSSGTVPSALYCSDTATGCRYGKVIINPMAVYLAEYDTSGAVAVTSTSGTACTQTGMAGTTTIQGHWLYFTGTAAGVKNSLRFVKISVASVATMDSALTVNAGSADTMMKVWRPNYALTALSSDGTKLNGGPAAEGLGSRLRVLDSFIQDDGTPFQPLRRKQFAGTNNLSNPHFYSQIVMLSTLY